MRFVRTEQVDAQPVAMEGASGVTMRLLIGREHGAPTFSMRQFTVAPGGHTPLHRHNYEHEVVVQSGKGVVQLGRTHRGVAAGDVLLVPANELHQFKATGDQPLVFLCLVPASFDCGDGRCQPTPGG